MKEVEALDKVIKFVEMKLEACGSFRDGPEGAALKSVMEYDLKFGRRDDGLDQMH